MKNFKYDTGDYIVLKEDIYGLKLGKIYVIEDRGSFTNDAGRNLVYSIESSTIREDEISHKLRAFEVNEYNESKRIISRQEDKIEALLNPVKIVTEDRKEVRENKRYYTAQNDGHISLRANRDGEYDMKLHREGNMFKTFEGAEKYKECSDFLYSEKGQELLNKRLYPSKTLLTLWTEGDYDLLKEAIDIVLMKRPFEVEVK